MKKYAIISIIINVVLLLIYFACFHGRKHFYGHDEIAISFRKSSQLMAENNRILFENSLDVLLGKAKLKEVISDVFCANEMIANDFAHLADSLINHRKISDVEIKHVFEEYDKALSDFFDVYKLNLWLSQKEAKLTTPEIIEKREHFDQECISKKMNLSIKSITQSSQQEKNVLLEGLKNHLRIVQSYSDNDFNGLLSGKILCGMGINRFFPAVIESEQARIGKEHETVIAVGLFSFGNVEEYSSVYLDGNKIDMKYGKSMLSFTENTIGQKQHEAIVVWTNPETKEWNIDTTIFNYTVTP